MNAVFRWGLIGLGVILALTAIAAGVLAFLVSRLDVRAEIERAVEQTTGRETTIAGPVGVSFWPVLGLRAEQTRLANAPGGRAANLASIEAIAVGVELQPLLRRDVVVRELVLERPEIALELDTQGRPNWAFRAAQTSATPARQSGAQPQARAISLRHVHVREGALSYFDARTNTGFRVDQVEFNTALTSLDAPAQLIGTLNYGGQRVALDVQLASPRAALRGTATNVTATMQAELLQAGFAGQVLPAAGALNGNVNAQGPSLRRMLAWLVAPIPDGFGLETFNVSGRLNTANQQIAFENAALQVDQVRGRGDVVLSQRRGKPYVSGRLELMDVDINPYLAASGRPQASAAEIAEAASAPVRTVDVSSATAPADAPIDLSGLRAINADLELTTHAVRVQRMRLDRSQLSFVINDGFLAATLHNISLYGGSGRGRVELDARSSVPRMRHELVGQGIDASAFLNDMAGFPNVEGRAEVNMTLVAEGATQNAILANTDGRVSFELAGGALRGVDLGGVATTIRRALNNQLVAPTARTELQGMSATFAIANGVMGSESLSFNTRALRLRGVALIDLPRRAVDVQLQPQAALLAIPFRITGPWSNLSYAASGSNGRNEILARVRGLQAESRAATGAAAASR